MEVIIKISSHQLQTEYFDTTYTDNPYGYDWVDIHFGNRAAHYSGLSMLRTIVI